MLTAAIIGDSHVDGSNLASAIRDGLQRRGYAVTTAGVGATSAGSWTKDGPACRPNKSKCVAKTSIPRPVDLLVVSLGTNDQANAYVAGADLAKRGDQNLTKILSLGDKFDAGRVVWIAPPWMGDRVRGYRNDAMRAIYAAADRRRVPYFDSARLTRPWVEAGAGDGVHVYGAKARAWGEAVLAYIDQGGGLWRRGQPKRQGNSAAIVLFALLAAAIGWQVHREK